MTFEIAVVGGAGHVGLPLAIAFASRNKKTLIYDLNTDAIQTIMSGEMPFIEPGAREMLQAAIKQNNIDGSSNPQSLKGIKTLIVVIGTPVDEHLNPDPYAVVNALKKLQPYLSDGQHVVLRSTVFPGVTALVNGWLLKTGLNIQVSFCPERIAEHKAMEELFSLPQIVSGMSKEAEEKAAELFRTLTSKIVPLSPEEAELAKLITNSWRYIKFAAANEFFMLANDRGLDFERIREALSYEYPRASDLPRAGFAAGPCLFKDTMQLSAALDNRFMLGHSAMLVNEGLPLYVISKMAKKFDLPNLRVGILGMAFKGESDDIRSSLSYKLKKALQLRCESVVTSDPFVPLSVDSSLVTTDELLDLCDVIIIGAPHGVYRDIKFTKPVVDVWNLRGEGVLI